MLTLAILAECMIQQDLLTELNTKRKFSVIYEVENKYLNY